MNKVTKEQIEDWKKEHGIVYALETEDGKTAFIKDPLSDFLTVKQAFAALEEEGAMSMAATYLSNSFLGGDPLTDESYSNYLADRLDEIAALPDYRVTKEDEGFVISSEGESLKVRKAMRADIIAAEQRNYDSIPYMTNAYILESICIEKKYLQKLEKEKPRAYLGMLRSINKVKDKTYVAIKKL